MTLREEIEALDSEAYAATDSVSRAAVLDIIKRWVDDELPKVIASAVDEALASTQFRDALARAIHTIPTLCARGRHLSSSVTHAESDLMLASAIRDALR